MWSDLHFLRPWWLLALLPWSFLLWWPAKRQQPWTSVCDKHLLPYLLQKQGRALAPWNYYLFLGTLFFTILSCTGPAFVRLPTPSYKPIQPKVVLLDMSESMQLTDLSPNRLDRAKFVLHDILTYPKAGQLGLIAYTGEPFVVSPLTDDGKTIDALLSSLTADIMPVNGQNLEAALQEAVSLIKAAGFTSGQILVLTSDSPSKQAIAVAGHLAAEHYQVSIMPLTAEPPNPRFQTFAKTGGGQVFPYSSNPKPLQHWVAASLTKDFTADNTARVPLWRDEGRWLLLPALLCLLPLFQRGRWQGVGL